MSTNMDYFQLFQLPVSFQPDMAAVKKQFYALSRQYHPDFFTNHSPQEQEEALEQSALINKAFKTLSHKDTLIPYVLQLHQIMEPDEKYALPQDFLMEMMELNEAAEFCNTDSDKARLQATIQNLQNKLYATVEPLFTPVEGHFSEKALLQIKDYYFKQKYLEKVLDTIQ